MEELQALPALTAEDFQPAKEAVETFLNQYLLEESMGGELPVENGEIPYSEMERVNQMIEDISYNNAKNFFQF